jgi:peptide/nickel transport system substrate-binding protein
MHSAIDTAARRCAVLVATGLLLPLAACSSSDDGGSGKAGGDIAVAARADVVEGGTLHWAVDAAPTTLNTFRTDAGQATSRIAGATLPALFTLDARGRPQLNEDYLVSAHVTSNAPQKVVYQLADDARWNNGRAIGVRDFVAQWKALNGRGAHASEFDAARNAGYDRIASVRRGDGPRQVEVTFREPYADWQALFTPLYPAEVMSKPRAFAADPKKGLPVSAGPFKLGKQSHDGKSVTLVRDAKWWGDKAKLDRIQLLAVPRGEREQALKRGRLELARVNRSTAGHIGSAQQLQGKNGEHAGRKDKESTAGLSPYVVRKTLAPAYTQLALNGASGPLTDERVRRAVARAVDRSKLAHDALDGLGLPTKPIGSHLRVSTQAGYHDNSDALGGPDVKSAEALLAEAGWKPGGSTAPEGDTGEAKPGGSDDGKHGRAGHTEKKSSRSARRDDLALRITPAEAARIGASPLSLTPFTAEQRAGLLGQAAAAGKRGAAQEDSSDAHKAAEAAEKRARAARDRADELNLLSSGRATLVRTKNGKPLSLRFVLPKGAEAEQLRATGERIVRMLNKVGVRTRVETVDSDDYFRTIAAGKYDLALYAWPVSAFPATDAQPIFAKPSPAAGGALAVQQNYTRVGTDQIDQLFRQASRELDDSKRQDLLRQADAHIWAIAGSVPLYQLPQLVAARHTLANAGAFGLRTPDYADIGFTKDAGLD